MMGDEAKLALSQSYSTISTIDTEVPVLTVSTLDTELPVLTHC